MIIREEELIYAGWVRLGTGLGLGLLSVAFLAYAFALLDPLVPVRQLPQLWGLPAAQFVQTSGAPTGWEWLAFLDKADYLNFLGVALLGLVALTCYLRLALALVARRAHLMTAIAIAQILVLLAAVSGLIGGAH